MRTVDDTVHQHRSSGGVIEGSTGVVDGRRSNGRVLDRPAWWLLDRLPARVLLLVQTVLQHTGDVLDGSAAVIVHPTEVMVVHVTGVIFQPTGMLDGAHRVVLHAAPHRRGGHGGRRLGMINGSRLLGTYLLGRSAH